MKNKIVWNKGTVGLVKSWSKGKNAKMDSRIISGKKHYNWKGGIYNNPNGYRYILKPEHPKANSKGYLAEHIVVIENRLRRYLKKGEIVHHINGNKKEGWGKWKKK